MKKFIRTALKATGVLAIVALAVAFAPSTAPRQWQGANWFTGNVGIGTNPSVTTARLQVKGRTVHLIADTVASAGNLVLGYDGNTFPVSGTTTINGISVTDWPSGSVIRLFFNASVTVADSASVTAPYQEINLSTGSNLSATKNDVLTLILNGTEWFEVSRTVNAD